MRYEVKFCKAWQGSWKFDASHDVMAWQKAQGKIDEQTLTVSVSIESIHELDCFDNPVRKLPDEKNCIKQTKTRGASAERERDTTWIAYFSNGENSAPFFAKAPDGIIADTAYAQDMAERKILKEYAEKNRLDIGSLKIVGLEKLVKNEIAIYKAYFSNGNNSAPYVAKLMEGDTDAFKVAELKLEQHAQYNSLDTTKLKVIKIIELNENYLFVPNTERVERNKRRKNRMPERKNRVVFATGLDP